MPFWFAESNGDGTISSGTITQLLIAPTYVSYPDHFSNTVKMSKDGSAIVQTPVTDMRSRKWTWRNYKTTVPKYNQLFNQVLNLQYKLRQGVGKAPWVYLKDDETLNLVYKQYNGTVWVEVVDFVQVKVTQVTQNIAAQGGYPTYSETNLEFFITDLKYTDF